MRPWEWTDRPPDPIFVGCSQLRQSSIQIGKWKMFERIRFVRGDASSTQSFMYRTNDPGAAHGSPEKRGRQTLCACWSAPVPGKSGFRPPPTASSARRFHRRHQPDASQNPGFGNRATMISMPCKAPIRLSIGFSRYPADAEEMPQCPLPPVTGSHWRRSSPPATWKCRPVCSPQTPRAAR